MPSPRADCRPARREAQAARLSVLVPISVDARRAYAQLRLMAPLRRCGVELIATAQRTDAAVAAVLRRAASRLLSVPGSLAVQYNAAAAFARADVLLLLPDGVLLPAFADQLVEQALEREDREWGWFDMRCVKGLRGLFVSAWLNRRARWRVQLHRTHPLFVRRGTFMAVGGVPSDTAGGVPAALARRLADSGRSPARITRPALAGYRLVVAPCVSGMQLGTEECDGLARTSGPCQPAAR